MCSGRAVTFARNGVWRPASVLERLLACCVRSVSPARPQRGGCPCRRPADDVRWVQRWEPVDVKDKSRAAEPTRRLLSSQCIMHADGGFLRFRRPHAHTNPRLRHIVRVSRATGDQHDSHTVAAAGRPARLWLSLSHGQIAPGMGDGERAASASAPSWSAEGRTAASQR